MEKIYSIELISRRLPNFYDSFHNYWVMRDQYGEIIKELHGLPTDKITGEIKLIETSRDDLIYAYNLDPQSSYEAMSHIPDQQEIIVLSESKEKIEYRWNVAVSAIPIINSLGLEYKGLNYSNVGNGSQEEIVDGDTVYAALGEIMGVRIFGFRESENPGIANVNLLLKPEVIETLREKLTLMDCSLSGTEIVLID